MKKKVVLTVAHTPNVTDGYIGFDFLRNITLTGHAAWEKSYTLKEYSVGARKIITEK